jgi:hypothetical protein
LGGDEQSIDDTIKQMSDLNIKNSNKIYYNKFNTKEYIDINFEKVK